MIIEILLIYAYSGLILSTLMVGLWLLSLFLRDSSIVDIFWGIGFVLITWIFCYLTPEGYLPRKLLVSLMVSIWGLRLAIHIFKRNYQRGEDFRYAKWREEYGGRWWWQSLYKVFLLQGLVLWIISAPLLAAQWSPRPSTLTWLDYSGLAVWMVGFIFEAVGDFQLARFRSDPDNRGRVLESGLWRYTRHPNYFGDAAQWWGNYLIAAAAGGVWTIFSPILMTVLLVRVSGVALIEKTLRDQKPGYREYAARTSAFFPLPPRKYRR